MTAANYNAWQIQARHKKHGVEWEPIAVEPARILDDGSPERKFEYASEELAVAALRKFLEKDYQLPRVVVRAATGRQRFLKRFDVRIARVTLTIDAAAELAEVFGWEAEIAAAEVDV